MGGILDNNGITIKIKGEDYTLAFNLLFLSRAVERYGEAEAVFDHMRAYSFSSSNTMQEQAWIIACMITCAGDKTCSEEEIMHMQPKNFSKLRNAAMIAIEDGLPDRPSTEFDKPVETESGRESIDSEIEKQEKHV